MSSSPKVTTLTGAKPVTKIHCGECNWEQLVLAKTEATLRCCPCCGWSDLEFSKVSEIGGFEEIECEVHGRMMVVIALDNIEVDDFLDNLFSLFCK